MGSSQLHILFLITLELTFCGSLLKKEQSESWPGVSGELEIEPYLAPHSQAWQSHPVARTGSGKGEAKIIW